MDTALGKLIEILLRQVQNCKHYILRLHHDQQTAHALAESAAAAYSNYPMSGMKNYINNSMRVLIQNQ